MPENTPPVRLLVCQFKRGLFPWHFDLFAPYWRFYWNRTPGGEMTIGGRPVPMSPDHFFILPGYMHFTSRAKQPIEQFFIHFHPDDRIRPSPDVWWRLDADAETVAIILDALPLLAAPEESYAASLTALAILTRCLLRLPPEILRVAPLRDPRIAAAERLLAFPTDRPPGNREMAERVHMSRDGFVRLFRKVVGESPQQYARRKRLEHACALLHFTDETIETIAMQTGFRDRYHFTRAFRRLFQVPPVYFRHRLSRPAATTRPES